MKSNRNTSEFDDVLCYMADVLGTEIPSVEYTTEYFILAMLDNSKCHASMIIENMLLSDSIESLHSYYLEKLSQNATGEISGVFSGNFSAELSRLMDIARQEADSKPMGTEHVLLALLNPENKFEERNVLSEYGIKYEYIKSKSSSYNEEQGDKNEPDETNENNIKMTNRIPLKSEINSKAFVQSGNTPFIDKYTINLHEEIEKGHYDKLIGREEIINNIIKVLSRRRKNNVILVGKPGVGKTSIGYKLAEMIDSDNVPEILEHKQVVMLDVIALVSGTHLRGMFEERVDGLFKELKANPNYILFIDDMQNVVRNTGKDKDGDLSDLIGNILTDGDIRVIATISFKNYRNGVENNSVLATKLQKIIVEPSTTEETFEILKNNKAYYENFHHVKFSDECIYKAIKLAKRYITNNSLPDSAIDVVDLTGASISLNNKNSVSLKALKDKMNAFDEEKKKAMNSGDFEKLDDIAKKESATQKAFSDAKKEIDNDDSTWVSVTENDIAETVSSITTIPVSKLTTSNKEIILNIDNILKKDIVGQDEAINEVAKAIKRSRAGFSDNNKCTTFLEIGPTGVGKTILAKKLALNVYGDENALVRFDMSEYQDKTSVNKLLGSSAGYVGYENGGLLTEAVKNKPYCVLLFDEIEKADESIYNVFLQLFDEGRLTDNNGTTVNFKNVIVIMTSNVGAKQASELGSGVGFQNNVNENKKSIVERSLKNKFNPEFLNRIDKIIHFNALTDENLKAISKIELNRLNNRVKENGVYLEYGDDVVDFVYNKAILEKEYGARPIMRIIQDNISDKVVDFVLSSNKKENKYVITAKDNEISVETVSI